MDSTLAPGPVFVVVGMTVRTCPRKTKGAFSAKSRTSAMDGGNIRRHQDWAVNKNIARLVIRVAGQARGIRSVRMAADSFEMLPMFSLLLLAEEKPEA